MFCLYFSFDESWRSWAVGANFALRCDGWELEMEANDYHFDSDFMTNAS